MSMPSAIRAYALTELNAKSDGERLTAYADPAWRAKVRLEVQAITGEPMDWSDVSILESPSSPDAVGKDLVSLGRERNRPPFEVLMDLAVADKLVTKVVITYGNGDVGEVTKLLRVEGAVLGLSDAGAHPAQTCDAVLPTDLLGNWVRGVGALPLETAVHKLTQEPARLMSLADRGLISPGYYADVVVFDPETIGPGEIRTVHDLPKDRERLLADRPTGVHHMLVNGVVVRKDEITSYAPSGRLLRPN
jgi:N-acyl-D-aspartate/D-glutamate deacylase